MSTEADLMDSGEVGGGAEKLKLSSIIGFEGENRGYTNWSTAANKIPLLFLEQVVS